MEAAMRKETAYNSLSEDLSKRSTNTKTFHVLPGRHRTMSFAEQVHYLDRASGAYEAIDNSLVSCEGGLQNKANGDMKVLLLPDGISLAHPDGYRLSWRVEGTKKIEPKVVAPEIDRKAAVRDLEEDLYGHVDLRPVSKEVKAARKKIAEALLDELNRVGSKAVYHEILPGADLVCTLSGANFKDHLVFASREAVQSVTLTFTSEGLTLKETEDSLKLLNDKGEAIYVFPTPVCMDSSEAGEQQEVKHTVEHKSEAEFAITYTLPEEWLEKAVFPVILDPAVVTYNARCAIQDAYSSSKQPNTAHSGTNSNLVRLTRGSSSWGVCNCFYRFGENVLPVLDSSDYIVYAQFRVVTAQSGYPTSAFDATVHEVTSTWTPGTLTHNNMPSYGDKVLDYSHLNSNEGEGHYHTFDITNLVRKWYSGTNFGVMLKAESNTYAQLRSSAYTQNTGYRPLVIIDYLSKAGLEGYLSYESHSIGRGGTGHVSLFNGNLIYEHQDTSTTGNILPVSVHHVYNSCYRGVQAFWEGFGWKLNMQQELRRETISGVLYYTWIDEDGTEVYFVQDNGEWKDLTGREMTLTIGSTEAVITDKAGFQRIFGVPTTEFNGDWGKVKPMTRMVNALGQQITLTLDGLKIQTMTDGAGRQTTSAWSYSLLTDLFPPGDSVGIHYNYPAGQVETIQYQDGKTTVLAYQSGTQLLTDVTNHDGMHVHYTYSATEPYRVTRVKVTNTEDNTEKVAFDHSYDYRDILTIVTDNLSGKKIRYHFNDSGNLVSLSDELGYGAASTYTPDGPINKPGAVSKLQRSVVNLVRDPLITNDSLWIQSMGSGCTGSFAHDSSVRLQAAASLRMIKTSVAGDINVRQPVTLTTGSTYTLSAWCRTEDATAVQIGFHYMNSMGGYELALCGAQTSVGKWTRISHTFTMPANAGSSSANVFMFGVGGVGKVWLEGAQLEEGVTPSRLNLLSNCDFRSSTVDWSVPAGATGGSVCAVSTLEDASTYPEGLGGQAYQLTGAGNGSVRRVAQEISVSGSKDDPFVAGGWSATFTAPRGSANERYRMELSFYNGSSWTSGGEILWGEEWSGWKFAAAPILAPCDYTKVQLILCYDGNYNTAAFGGLFLHKEEFGQSYQYDSKGNVISTKDTAELKDHAEYDEYNNLTEYRQPGRPEAVKTTLSYGATDEEKQQRLLKQIVSPLGIQTDYTHDTHGNVTETQVSHSGLFTKSSAGYSADGNYALTKTDARGNTTTRTVDSNLGTVGSVTDPMNHTVSYTHDMMKRVTKTETTVDGKTYKTTYTYTNDRLTQVSRRTAADDSNPVVYNFTYDVLGRPTVTKVGTSITLSTTSYNADGTVQRVTFGNNGRVDYVYDSFKRLTGVSFDGASAVRFAYTYGNNGEVAQVVDSVLGRVVRSEYDLANRPCRKTTFTTSGAPIYEAQVGYDEYGNVCKFQETVAGSENHTTNFIYDEENRPTVLTYENGQAVTYTYDALGRIQKRSVGFPEGSEVETTYTYVPGLNGATTPLIQTISQNGVTLTYAYDANGNITSVSDGTNTVSYVYDGIGQLIRVNDPTDPTANTSDIANGTTWVFTYDLSGNILTKTAYHHTTGAVGTAVESHIYSYGATTIGGITYGTDVWKDQLAAIDGVGITYDAVGNPTNDGTWTYTWQHGKQLQQMQKTENGVTTTVQFEYNEDGLRTKKTVTVGNDTVVTEYVLHGKNIVHMTRGSDSLHFLYDAQGKPAEVIFNGAPYKYLYNLQGDVIALADISGTKVVEYSYDAWGKPTGKTGAIASTLGTVQPFRYRGYVFDEEAGLYYLRSRYYKPSWGRFISADETISGALYPYASDNPTNYTDFEGHESQSLSEGQDVLQIIRDGNEINIIAHIFVTGPISPDLIKDGIESYWTGAFQYNNNPITLTTEVIVETDSAKKAIPFDTYDAAGKTLTRHYPREVPYQSSRCRVELFRSYSNGKRKSDARLMWSCAHEFGHVLGIGDYYKLYPNDTAFPSIMNQPDYPVSDSDIEKLIQVIETGVYATW